MFYGFTEYRKTAKREILSFRAERKFFLGRQ
jgi:hypothetical protein